MKKLIIILVLLLIPIAVGASFDNNLYYGLQNNAEVTELQEFLTDQGVYSGPITGNFYSLTLEGVKSFQKKEKISPVAGYFGPLTRARANELLSANIDAFNQQAVQETGSTPPIPTPPATTEDVIANLQAQIALLLQQLQTMQAQQTSTQQIAQNTQQIVQNTTPLTCTPNWQCGSWGECINSKQLRTCNDSNNCGVATGRPSEIQSCGSICTPNWVCSTWSSCVDRLQTRTCVDANSCGVSTNKPSVAQSCGTDALTVSCNGIATSFDDPEFKINYTSNVSGGDGDYKYYWDTAWTDEGGFGIEEGYHGSCWIDNSNTDKARTWFTEFSDAIGILDEDCPMTAGPTFTATSSSIPHSSIKHSQSYIAGTLGHSLYWIRTRNKVSKKDYLTALSTLFVKSGDETVGVHCPITNWE